MRTKTGIITLAATAAILLAGTAARAGDDAHHAAGRNVTLAEWTDRLETEIDRSLVQPRSMGGREPASGVVRVKFNCSEDGRTSKVSVLRSSGSRQLDRAAVSTIERLASMHPLPTGMGPDQQYQALILYGSGPGETAETRLRLIRSEAAKRNGWFKPPMAVGPDTASSGM